LFAILCCFCLVYPIAKASMSSSRGNSAQFEIDDALR